MKRDKLIKHLRFYGCELFREGGKHSIFLNPQSGKLTAIPRHPDIKRFTIANICKDLDIPLPSEK
jgi:mRNA interferase HicA